MIRFIRAISFNVEVHNEHFIHAHTVNSILLQYDILLIGFPSTSIEHLVLEGDDSVGDNSEIFIIGKVRAMFNFTGLKEESFWRFGFGKL